MRILRSGLMNTLAMALIGVAFSATAAFAQGGSGRHQGLGIQVIGGPLFANITDAKGLDTGNKSGWLAGLALGGNRGGVLGVEADVLYGQKGAKVNGEDFDQHVIDVPVMLKANIGSSSVNGLSFFAQGGGFFDWQFDSKLNKVDISQDTNGYEIGVVVGAGVELLRFSVQGRYIRGLREIDKSFNLGSTTDIKTQAFAILVAFRLN